MKSHSHAGIGRFRAASAALFSCILFSSHLPAKPDDASVTYSGRAAVSLVNDSSEVPPSIVDTGPLPSFGGTIEVSSDSVSEHSGDLSFETAYATTSGVGPQTFSLASANSFHIVVKPMNGAADTEIDADVISATATASAAPSGKVDLDSSSDIEGLTVNGQAVAVTGQPNQTISFPGGTIVINEITSSVSSDQTSGALTVVAIHIFDTGCFNGTFGVASAGIASVKGSHPPPPTDCGKLTGGGWITGPSGAKATFAVSGGIRDGSYWGHLNYIDHGTGMHVQSTAVTGFTDDSAGGSGRIITYNVTIDGQAGTAQVHAVDNGEPGRHDIFGISLSNGYAASGTLGGGNIQLHKCPPGWAK